MSTTIDFKRTHMMATEAKQHGGTEGAWGMIALRLLARIQELENELQEARQLKLFGDVTPPRTPWGT